MWPLTIAFSPPPQSSPSPLDIYYSILLLLLLLLLPLPTPPQIDYANSVRYPTSHFLPLSLSVFLSIHLYIV